MKKRYCLQISGKNSKSWRPYTIKQAKRALRLARHYGKEAYYFKG